MGAPSVLLIGSASSMMATRPRARCIGRPVVVHSAVTADFCYFGDLSRAVMTYMRQGVIAESSRSAEFALDNTLFRFGMRFDIALVEEGQINEHPNA